MADFTTITLNNIDSFKAKALTWANQFRVCCLLDSNSYPHKNYKDKDWLLAIDAIEELTTSENNIGSNSFEKLKAFQAGSHSTIFGFLSYDLKNEIENLESKKKDGLKFPELFFFKPRYVFEIADCRLTVNRNYPETFELLELINNIELESQGAADQLKLKSRTSKESYLQNIERIRKQIEAGDFYELNYCNEFFEEGKELNPVKTFLKLNQKALTPFSCFFKLNEKFLMCASPERFLKREGTKMISQPIKGTIAKGQTAGENNRLKTQLKNDIKERAENVMIVDLVRNDLARSSKAGTVKVEELCEVYEFNAVNQMISTITSTPETNSIDAIKNAFPMGSMTGAPKIEVMKNIEHYEDFKRGLYSGSVGYITPAGDFDLNVVIRSILYNAGEKYISVRVGGAITYDSNPENEWNEILLKAKSMLEVLEARIEY